MTTDSSGNRRAGAGAEIVHRLRQRMATDSGFAALLRRSAGRPLGESRALTAWYDFVAELPESIRPMREADVELLFLLATLFAHDRNAYRLRRAAGSDAADPASVRGSQPAAQDGAPPGRKKSFGGTLAEVRRAKPVMRDSLTRRLAILLDASLDAGDGSLQWRLRQAVKLALSSGAAIEWAALLDDLRNWNRPDQRVQRRWARDFVVPHERAAARADSPAPVATTAPADS